MKNNPYAIEVYNIRKSFHLPYHKHDSIKQAVTQIFKSKKKGVNSFNALDDVSFRVKKGDFFGILGRNGSGKSTLLKIIADIYVPTLGSVCHDGKLVSFIELGVGFNPELSGRENVFLNAALLGFSKSEIAKMYDDIVSFAELEDFMDQKLKNYSSGMRVRLAFSVAIRARADILVLDEVLAVGDAAFQQKCNDYFKTLKNDKKTVVLVTHNMNAVREFCNRAIVIDQGVVMFEGQADEAADRYLALFDSDNKNKKRSEKKDSESVDKRVTIENLKSLTVAGNLEIEVELKSRTKQEGVKLAVRVLDTQGRIIAGVNTQSVINPITIDLDANKSKVFRFTMPNILGDGTFSIDARVGSIVDAKLLYDKFDNDDATCFTNLKPDAPYPILLHAKVEERLIR